MAYKPRKITNKGISADISLLSEEDKLRLREEATTKVKAERKLAAEEAFLDQVTNEARREGGLDETHHAIQIDLPLYADRLVIDGVIYLQGQVYTVGQGLYNVIREQTSRMWGHQLEIDGKRSDPRVPKNRLLTPRGVVNTTGSLRM